MNLTYYGHSCFGVELAGHHLLFDPFITANPLAKSVDLASIRADFILLSHGHEDHVADAALLARQTGATILCNFEIYLWLSRQDLTRFIPMNHGGTAKLGNATAKLVSAIHSSSLPDGSNGGSPGGWVIDSPDGAFYYSGDTALTQDMKIIGETTRLRFAALCLGDTFTMGPADAITAARWVGASQVVGVHYDTFPPIQIDHAAVTRQFAEAQLTLHLPPIGQTIEL